MKEKDLGTIKKRLLWKFDKILYSNLSIKRLQDIRVPLLPLISLQHYIFIR